MNNYNEIELTDALKNTKPILEFLEKNIREIESDISMSENMMVRNKNGMYHFYINKIISYYVQYLELKSMKNTLIKLQGFI